MMPLTSSRSSEQTYHCTGELARLFEKCPALWYIPEASEFSAEDVTKGGEFSSFQVIDMLCTPTRYYEATR